MNSRRRLIALRSIEMNREKAQGHPEAHSSRGDTIQWCKRRKEESDREETHTVLSRDEEGSGDETNVNLISYDL